MDRRAQLFKYRLAPLLKLGRWEGNVLGVELRRARIALDEKQRLHTEILQRIEQAQAEMRAMHQHDRPIPIEKRRLLSAYLQEQYAVAETRRTDAVRAQQIFEQIMTQRVARQQKNRALEQHRSREKQEHDAEQNRAGLRDADESWLITRR